MAFFVINLCVIAILWLGGNRIGAGFMKIGDITALTEYAILILFYIMMAQMVLILLPRAKVCLQRVETVLKHEPEIPDVPASAASSLFETDDVLRFDHASFRFPDADEETLGDLSFTCRRGTTTAIIGGTGSGKSTIAKLILRFHDTTSGAVFFRGEDVRSIPQGDLRNRIAYVPQKAWLFSGTIADNLRHGKADATLPEMEHALSVAQASFVQELPEQLDSFVAQGGSNFSGGQKQRLSIARALMKQADLYIFDDSFSALDFKTDAALRKALQPETRHAAVLIIAQRVSTILHADQILVLDDGKIVGAGTHESLMQTCPVYQDIAKSQQKGEEANG